MGVSSNALRLNQERAVTTRGKNLVVVAGAGTGKTRVLVDRFLSLLADGIELPTLVAITFTEKAAGEMRTRVRDAITARAENAAPAERPKWERALRAMDAARIGTIHSLCATLLRANPVEAQLDPGFEILDESDALIWQEDAFDNALTEFAERGGAELGLFREYKIEDVRRTGLNLLKLGNLVQQAFDCVPVTREELLQQWQTAVDSLRQVGWTQFTNDARWREASVWVNESAAKSTDALEKKRAEDQELLEILDFHDQVAGWSILREFAQRRKVGTAGGEKNWDDLQLARTMLNTLREVAREYVAEFDHQLTTDDERAAELILLWRAFWGRAQTEYARRKTEARVLDFDDLESQARSLLLQHPVVRERYRREIASVLVDEFQDTNGAQRDILYSLADLTAPNRLFVVGDGKQSIYGFRGADVTVFQQTLLEITQRWGSDAYILLDESFRAHVDLAECFNQLFAQLFALPREHSLYHVPYDAMRGLRTSLARDALIEIVQIPKATVVRGEEQRLGADEVRAWDAEEIAARVGELIAQEFQVWDKSTETYRPARFGDVALLFRVGTSLPIYEEALKRASIPYITYAGTGYYDRPEVRDLIHLLRALDNPADELAVATVLHSPLYALSSETLFRLRRGNTPLQVALCSMPDDLMGEERAHAEFAAASLQGLWARVGRVTILDLLQQALAETCYLATISGLSGGTRRRANVEKLLALARRTGLARLSEFNAYLSNLTSREVREGEAFVEPENAVQLMTIHRAKGLEFPIVVLPDAGRAPYEPPEWMTVNRASGIGVKVHDENGEPVMPVGFRLLRQDARARDAQEEKRLLYVAMTRAQEYLIVSGSDTPHADSYLQQLLDARAKLDPPNAERIVINPPRTVFENLENHVTDVPIRAPAGSPTEEAAPLALPPLSTPLDVPTVDDIMSWTPTGLEALVRNRSEFEQRVLEGAPERIIPVRRGAIVARAPAYIVGEIAHRALQRWRFPDNTPNLDQILDRYARERGLNDEEEISDAVHQARGVLARLARSKLFQEMESALVRHHELPFVLAWQGRMLHGAFDALFQDAANIWRVVDFKTDRLRGQPAQEYTLERYGVQMSVYLQAAKMQLGAECVVCVYYIRESQAVILSEEQLTAELEMAMAQINPGGIDK